MKKIAINFRNFKITILIIINRCTLEYDFCSSKLQLIIKLIYNYFIN